MMRPPPPKKALPQWQLGFDTESIAIAGTLRTREEVDQVIPALQALRTCLPEQSA